ncbi:hypothetical protein GUJ93_ZPchr0012g20150 [Zizania palustris]|uniref:Uncharacterized protein n=1 Tax=Zizania palustris TaxID=103762 RepID=A0A8J5WPW1_ZIZPA|nr:hypothetical protein GUJ93_ZPchr0012g20150 [Zizania palustris]
MTTKGGAPPSPGGLTGLANGRFFTVGLVTSWYSSNISVLLLNKYLLSNYGFNHCCKGIEDDVARNPSVF